MSKDLRRAASEARLIVNHHSLLGATGFPIVIRQSIIRQSINAFDAPFPKPGSSSTIIPFSEPPVFQSSFGFRWFRLIVNRLMPFDAPLPKPGASSTIILFARPTGFCSIVRCSGFSGFRVFGFSILDSQFSISGVPIVRF